MGRNRTSPLAILWNFRLELIIDAALLVSTLTMTADTANTALARMCRRGWLTRIDTGTRRAGKYRISPAGRAVIDRIIEKA